MSHAIDRAPAGNLLDSLPRLGNNDPEWFACKTTLINILAETETVLPRNQERTSLLSRKVNRMSCWNLKPPIIAVFFFSLLLTPGVISAADKLSALYSAQSVSYSLPWIAQDAGLFRKHNLDFQLVYIPSSGVATAALLGGDVEIALAGGVGIVRAFAQGANDLVFIGGFKNALTHSIVAKPDMTKPEDLRGKKIGITRLGSNSHYFAVQALRRMGLDASRDVALIQAGGEPEIVAALVNGAIDAGSITTPADNRAVAQGFRYLLFGPDLQIAYAAATSSLAVR